jgi:Fic family protein
MDITDSPSGKVISTAQGYNAFVPNPLPPAMNWTPKLALALSKADFLLGKLAREGSQLSNPHLLIHPFITREAVLSSKIEGTHSTISQVLAHDAGIAVDQDPEDLKEVQNYISAMDFGIKRLETLPLSLRLIQELHSHLMQNVRGFHATPGEFRRSQNWIGTPGCTINTAKFVPPPMDHLMDCLGDLEAFLHYTQLPALIHIAMCHYQFEAIHPFLDGNGRVGRLLIVLLLIERKILPSPLLYLSAFFEATRDEYYKQLFNVSASGSWEEWLIYFLSGVSLQAEDTLSRTERINALLEKWKWEAASGQSDVAFNIVEYLASNPYLTINRIAKEMNTAYSTASRAVLKLQRLNILQQIGETKRGKIYCASAILAILEEPTKVYCSS